VVIGAPERQLWGRSDGHRVTLILIVLVLLAWLTRTPCH
jgi:hypothetical protein